jgi:hypothetical protein
MGLQIIPNQPIKLLALGEETAAEREACYGSNTDYCQRVVSGQVSGLQIKMLEATGERLETNGDFTNNITGWTVVAGQIVWNAGSALWQLDPANVTNGTLKQQIAVEDGKRYKVTFQVSGLSGVAGIFFVGNGTSFTYDVPLYLVSGTYSNYFTANVTGNVDFGIVCFGSCRLHYISVTELTMPVITVNDATGASVLTPEQTFKGANAIYNISWFGLNPGTYTVCAQPFGFTSENHFDCALAITDGNGVPLTDGNGECITDDINNFL